MALEFDKIAGYSEALENLNQAIEKQEIAHFIECMHALAKLVYDFLAAHPVGARGQALSRDDINEITLPIYQDAIYEYELKAKEVKKA